jgi:flagellin
MKINNNISAVITNKQLLRTEDNLSAAMQRLSSGLKINHSKDDPSGMAISGKMHTQIEGLSRASQNANDGVSVIQTADGALNEVTSMLQRMRELSVQAANDLNSSEEKEAIQKEINSLRSEINRVSTDTEFNTKTLLDGSLDTRVYGDHFSRTYVSESVTAGTYKMQVNAAAEQANASGTKVLTGNVTATQAGSVKINGVGVKITEGMSVSDVYEAVRKGAEEASCHISSEGDPLKISSDFYGKSSSVEVVFENDELKDYFGFADLKTTKNGTDADITLEREDLTTNPPTFGFSKQATVSTDGNRFTVTDTNGFEMDFLAQNNAVTDATGTVTSGWSTGELNIEVTDMGPMVLQIGANESQNMTVRIPSISSENMYLDEVDVTKAGGADRAMSILDKAIARVSEIRSGMGANQNRLESTVKSLDDTDENMNSAVSRIEDADMAAEMADYTKYNVLQQAATSVLSQANEIPQTALQLLQK